METFLLALLTLLILAGGGVAVWLFFRQQKAKETPYLFLQQQLDGLRGDFLKVLEQNRQGIDSRLDNAAKIFTGLETRMVRVEEVTRQVLEVGKDISGLQQILKAPKLRGNFGEELLSDLLSQMMPQENFELQYNYKNGERVDAVIRTAQGLVPIDSKFPLENFTRLIATENEETKKTLRKMFVQDVRKHVTDIANKYIRPSEGTFEFALMYIPAENVYYEMITKDMDAGEQTSVAAIALKKKVIPVSPNTFYAYLQTILLGLRGMQVEKRVREIVTQLAQLRKGLTGFRNDFALLGKHLKNATSSFEKSDRRLTKLDDKLASLEAAPEKEALATPSAAFPTDKSLEDVPRLEQ